MAKIFSIKGGFGLEDEFFNIKIQIEEDAQTLEVAKQTNGFFMGDGGRLNRADGDVLGAYALMIADRVFTHGWEWRDGADVANRFFEGNYDFNLEGWASREKQGFKILEYRRNYNTDDLEVEITNVA